MQEVHEQRIRENLTALVDLTTNVEDIVKALKDKEIINEEEEEKITTAGSPFDKKSQLYWLITKKDDAAFNTLISVLRSTGNNEAADKLEDNSSENHVVVQTNVDVTVESPKADQQDGIGFDIEKEFERIQSEVEESEQDEPDKRPESEIASALVAEVFQEALEKALDQPEEEIISGDNEASEISEENDVESEVVVEVTPPESDPEVEEEHISSVEVAEEKIEEPEIKMIEKEPEVVPEIVEEKEPKKQVKFESPKEFKINKNESEDSESASEASISPNSKSLVQQNRQLFEKQAPAGVKVKYSFRKHNEPAVEEPKESTVKNLRNFFQKLGSVDNADVNGTSGTKLGSGNPNRKSLAS